MLLKHLVSIIFLPFTVISAVPVTLVGIFDYSPFWGLESNAIIILLILGLFLISSGLILLFSTTFLFISKGEGTIAPWSPTNKLIKIGVYAYIRNPMITGVFFILVGESVILGSFPLIIYVIAFILGNLVYIPLIEEPKLIKKFGKKYLIYKEVAPSWIPHFSWKKPKQ